MRCRQFDELETGRRCLALLRLNDDRCRRAEEESRAGCVYQWDDKAEIDSRALGAEVAMALWRGRRCT